MTGGNIAVLRWNRWETWAGLVVCGGVAGIGSWLGQRVGHQQLGAIIGGAIGGCVLRLIRVHVAARDEL